MRFLVVDAKLVLESRPRCPREWSRRGFKGADEVLEGHPLAVCDFDGGLACAYKRPTRQVSAILD